VSILIDYHKKIQAVQHFLEFTFVFLSMKIVFSNSLDRIFFFHDLRDKYPSKIPINRYRLFQIKEEFVACNYNERKCWKYLSFINYYRIL